MLLTVDAESLLATLESNFGTMTSPFSSTSSLLNSSAKTLGCIRVDRLIRDE